MGRFSLLRAGFPSFFSIACARLPHQTATNLIGRAHLQVLPLSHFDTPPGCCKAGNVAHACQAKRFGQWIDTSTLRREPMQSTPTDHRPLPAAANCCRLRSGTSYRGSYSYRTANWGWSRRSWMTCPHSRLPGDGGFPQIPSIRISTGSIANLAYLAASASSHWFSRGIYQSPIQCNVNKRLAAFLLRGTLAGS